MSLKKEVPWLQLFLAFFKIGAFTIGGGLAMLPLIEKEAVEKQKWITHEEFVDVFAVAQSVPGVIAINSSIYIGYKIQGLRGAIIATLGITLPSFIIIIPVAYLMLNVKHNIYIDKAFTGVRAGVTALIAIAAFRLGKSVIKNNFSWCIAILSFLLIVVFEFNPILTILLSGLAGLLALMLKKEKKS